MNKYIDDLKIINLIKELDNNGLLIKGKENGVNDRFKDVIFIISEMKKRNYLTQYPEIDQLHRVYYLYEETVFDKKYRNTIDPCRSAYEYLIEITKGYKGTALTIDHPISYDKFKEDIEKDAFINSHIGIKSNDRVTFLLPSMPETYSNFYALSKINAGRNMVDLRTSKEGLIKYINETESKYLFCMETIRPDILKDIILKSSVQFIRLFTPPIYEVHNKIKRYFGNIILWFNENGYKKVSNKLLMPNDAENIRLNYRLISGTQYDDSKPTIFMHTSGTSGFPKTVMANDKNINIMANVYLETLMDMAPGYRSLGIMPPWIFYGIFGFHMPFANLMNVYPIADAANVGFDDIMTNIKPNTIAGVPNHWLSLLTSKKIKKDFKLDFLKTPACGGDGISRSNNDKMNVFLLEHKATVKLAPGYALSENTSIASANQGIYNKSGSVGIMMKGCNCAIIDPSSLQPLKYNEHGIICINGDLMMGYLGKDEETQKVFIYINGEKYINTGDIGYIDQDGFLYVLGRQKNLIVRYDGFKIAPIEIENVISNHKGVKNCVVVGVRDRRYKQGELPVAIIELENKKISRIDEKRYLKEIEKECKEKLSSYYMPTAFYIDCIPLTNMGKVDRDKIKKELLKYGRRSK